MSFRGHHVSNDPVQTKLCWISQIIAHLIIFFVINSLKYRILKYGTKKPKKYNYTLLVISHGAFILKEWQRKTAVLLIHTSSASLFCPFILPGVAFLIIKCMIKSPLNGVVSDRKQGKEKWQGRKWRECSRKEGEKRCHAVRGSLHFTFRFFFAVLILVLLKSRQQHGATKYLSTR